MSLVDTGAQPSTGDALEASLLSGGVPDVLSADTVHAFTVGQGDRSRSEGSLASFSLTVGQDIITAEFLLSRTMALSQSASALVSGSSTVEGLVVNGQPVTVTGLPNQVVPLQGGELVVNERQTSNGGSSASITISALHVKLGSSADLIIATSMAGITAGQQNCSSPNDFASGGGWIPPAGAAKQTFGFVAGIKNGSEFGHFVFVDHGDNHRVQGSVAAFAGQGDTRTFSGPAEINGQAEGTFTITMTDNGEPGAGTDRITIITNRDTEVEVLLEGGNLQVHKPCH